MRHAITALTFLAVLLFAMPQTTRFAAADSNKMRTFLFIGEPNAAVWKSLIEKPADRQKAASQAIEKLGGKMLSY